MSKGAGGWGARTVRKELAEHKGVIGLGVVSWKADIFVHVEGDHMFEAGTWCHLQRMEVNERRTRAFPP